MVIAIVPVVLVVVGALMFALSSNGKVAEIGRLMVMAGFIGISLLWGREAVHL